MVLSVSESEVTIEVRVNEQMARKKTLMGNEHNDTYTDFTPTWSMKKYTEVFIR